MPADRPAGLSEAEVAARLAADGYNELPRTQRRSALRIAAEVLREPMFQLLLAAGGIYLALGDPAEALLLLGFASASVAITVIQQLRTERSLEALRELSSPRALVIRDGEQQRIPGRELVCGDIVLLSEGDRVPADLQLISAHDLEIDESLLTGESMPVGKQAAAQDDDSKARAYSGTLVARGDALGRVFATGTRSELGRIGQMLGRLEEPDSPLHRQTRRLVRWFASVGLGVSALVVLIHGLAQNAWLEGLLAGVALAMAMLPEEFPLVLTVFLALGAWRIARQRVLTRRASAIETLGAATVLCTDKTGTLTQNRMSVVVLHAADGRSRPPALSTAARTLLAHAVQACKPLPVDPMDRALHALAAEKEDALPAQNELLREYGLSAELPAMAMVWQHRDGTRRIAAKGAPEAIFRLCALAPAQREALRAEVETMAAQGMRVLGVAHGQLGDAAPDRLQDLPLQYAGLLGFSDPLRDTAAAAIADCHTAGIRVMMITGDHPVTAHAIAQQAGIATTAPTLTGAALAPLDDTALREQVRQATVCARVVPEQKLRIVRALQANGEVVAMTGDGVNDAPALKAAHIGVAMGGRGTDVAREAAALVLLDDDFGSLVAAVRQGRRIYDNLRKAMSYILAVHVPIAGLSLLPLLLGWPMILTPIHIVFLELVIDPVCSIVFEAEREERDLMRRPPRRADEPLFTRRIVVWSLLQGLAGLAMVTLLFVWSQWQALPTEQGRALAFCGLVASNLALIFVNRSFGSSLLQALREPNPALWRVIAITLSLLLLVLGWPAARALFGFGTLGIDAVAVLVAATLLLVFALEALKSRVAPFRVAAAHTATARV